VEVTAMSDDRDSIQTSAGSDDVIIRDEDLRDLVGQRAQTLLGLARHVLVNRDSEAILARTLLGSLMFESAQLVELLDAFGARHNAYWCRFRVLASTIKQFARICYELAHLRHALPDYRLRPVDGDFAAATLRELASVNRVVKNAAAQLLGEANAVGVSADSRPTTLVDSPERVLSGRLSNNRVERRAESAAAIVTQLATEFLNLGAESELLHRSATLPPNEYADCIPNPVSEDHLRHLTFRFHNLQSLYDTHVAGTKLETLDKGLATLRGHASAIFHLLETATDLAHFYERHLSPQTGDSVNELRSVITAEGTLASLFGYAIVYSSGVLSAGERLCQEMLRRYAELGKIEVPVPNYRGFHVRPSNLVARIARHYGSDLRMELDGVIYDAASPLELFRANEAINARKRRWLAREVAGMALAPEQQAAEAISDLVLDVVHKLADQGKLVFYQQPVQLSDDLPKREGSALVRILAEISHLQATGQLDIRTDLTVEFSGDKRVLADIDLLARQGYGEDCYGNNIVLPTALAYLRR
jgi:hypothetical protein